MLDETHMTDKITSTQRQINESTSMYSWVMVSFLLQFIGVSVLVVVVLVHQCSFSSQLFLFFIVLYYLYHVYFMSCSCVKEHAQCCTSLKHTVHIFKSFSIFNVTQTTLNMGSLATSINMVCADHNIFCMVNNRVPSAFKRQNHLARCLACEVFGAVLITSRSTLGPEPVENHCTSQRKMHCCVGGNSDL